MVDITVEEIKEQRQRHLDGAATYEEKEGPARQGDQLQLEFVGKVDDEVIAESSSQFYELGSNQFLPEFEAALDGIKAGEEKDFDLTFPSDYNEEKLRDKTAAFHVKVKKVQQKIETEINEEFFKRYGDRVKSEEEFDNLINDEVKFRKENEVKREQRESIRKQLNDLMDFDVPEQLLEEEINIRVGQAKRNNENEGKSDEDLKGEVADDAKKDLRFSIFVQKILEEEELKPDEREVYHRFELNCTMMGIQPQELMQQDYGRQIYQQIFGIVAEETVLDFLIEKIREK